MSKIWIIADTHFNHGKLVEYCNRPVNFEELIINNIIDNITYKDILIHLGDISVGDDKEWNDKFINLKEHIGFRLWLCKGNHEEKTDEWYLKNGWDFICRDFTMKYKQKLIAFSHKPIKDNGYDYNIHGHFHNASKKYHEPELVVIKNDKQILVSMEYRNSYSPILLDTILKNIPL